MVLSVSVETKLLSCFEEAGFKETQVFLRGSCVGKGMKSYV